MSEHRIRESREKAKVLMLIRETGTFWSPYEIVLLRQMVRAVARVSDNPDYPNVILVEGWICEKDEIAKIVGHDEFALQVVEGLDNLPFEPL